MAGIFWCVLFIFTFLYLTLSNLGAKNSFVVTDKYKKKKTICNWGKPCIWLNNKNPLDITQEEWVKDWLLANCIFINLEHRIYIPPLVIPDIFQPRPLVPIFIPSTPIPPTPPLPSWPSTPVVGPSRLPDPPHITYLEDIAGPGYNTINYRNGPH